MKKAARAKPNTAYYGSHGRSPYTDHYSTQGRKPKTNHYTTKIENILKTTK